MPLRIVSDQLGQPTVVRHGTGPLKLGDRIFRRQTQSSTKRRCVLLCNAIRKNDFRGNAVFGQHFMALFVIPRARQFLLYGCAPLVIDFFDEELRLSLVHHVDLDIDSHIDEVMVFRVDVGLVLRYRQSSVAISGNNS